MLNIKKHVKRDDKVVSSKYGEEMIIVFNHLFLYGIIGVERGEFLVNELRKIMGLDEGYKVIKVEEKKNGKTVAKYICKDYS